jgi:polar amino acid transport system substrate-binding protein
VVRLAAEDSWPPYSDGQGKGLSHDLVKAAFKAVKHDVKVSVMPYARVEYLVQSGQFNGGFNVTRQESTESLFLFGKQSLLKAPASFFFNASDKTVYKSYDDIPDGTRIGLILGYEYGDIYQKNRERFKEVRVSKQHQIIRMLISGRIDAAIMFDEVAAYTLREKLSLKSDAIVKGFKNHVSDIYLAFSLKHPMSGVYSERLDAGLKRLRASGEYGRIVQQHLGR